MSEISQPPHPGESSRSHQVTLGEMMATVTMYASVIGLVATAGRADVFLGAEGHAISAVVAFVTAVVPMGMMLGVTAMLSERWNRRYLPVLLIAPPYSMLLGVLSGLIVDAIGTRGVHWPGIGGVFMIAGACITVSFLSSLAVTSYLIRKESR